MLSRCHECEKALHRVASSSINFSRGHAYWPDWAAPPVYQWRNAFRRNMAVNCSLTRLNISWMAVVLPTKVALIFKPLGLCMMLHQ